MVAIKPRSPQGSQLRGDGLQLESRRPHSIGISSGAGSENVPTAQSDFLDGDFSS